MASNFAFTPMGLSQRVTVSAAANTITFAMIGLTSKTQTVASGLYPVPGVRIVNDGTAAVFLQFGPSATGTTVTTGLNTGMEVLANTVETFRLNGMNVMAYISGGTTTLGLTVGEGL